MKARFYEKICASEWDVQSFGAVFARCLKAGDMIALTGMLGAGKTTFVRGLVQSVLGQDEDVPSPTYTLVQSYDLPDYELWHCDLYRLETPDDVLELGLIDMQDDIVSLIEWPDKMGDYLSPEALNIEIEILENGHRKISLSGGSDWSQRVADQDLFS